MRNGVLVLQVVLLIAALVGCGAPLPELRATTTPRPTQVPQPTVTPVPGPLRTLAFHEPGWSAEIVRLPDVLSTFVEVAPDGRPLFCSQHGDTIWEVKEGGDIELYARFPNVKLEEFHFDPEGRLWFSTNRDGLYRVNAAGGPERVTHGGVNRRFDFDSQGNLYAVDFPSNNVQKITPEGEVSVVAEGFTTFVVEVGPQEEVVTLDTSGRLLQVLPDGQVREIASGLDIESMLGFAADGTLYALSWPGLFSVDLATGTVTRAEWYDRFSNTGNGVAMDDLGNLYTFHANHPIYRVSLVEHTSEAIYSSRGNTTAMALDPQGTIYVAYGDLLPGGESTIYRIGEGGVLEQVASIPYGIPLALAFDSAGTGYIGLGDREAGGSILTFDRGSGTVAPFVEPQCWPQSIAVDPLTGEVWWTACDSVFHRDQAGAVSSELAPANSQNKFLFFGPDATLYAVFWFAPPGHGEPAPHGIYVREEEGAWTELADMTNEDPYITWAMAAVCPDGRLYAITHTDTEEMGISGWKGTLNGVLRLEPDGTLKLMAGGFSVDAFAVVCDAQTGDLVFTSIDAIYRLKRGE